MQLEKVRTYATRVRRKTDLVDALVINDDVDRITIWADGDPEWQLQRLDQLIAEASRLRQSILHRVAVLR